MRTLASCSPTPVRIRSLSCPSSPHLLAYGSGGDASFSCFGCGSDNNVTRSLESCSPDRACALCLSSSATPRPLVTHFTNLCCGGCTNGAASSDSTDNFGGAARPPAAHSSFADIIFSTSRSVILRVCVPTPPPPPLLNPPPLPTPLPLAPLPPRAPRPSPRAPSTSVARFAGRVCNDTTSRTKLCDLFVCVCVCLRVRVVFVCVCVFVRERKGGRGCE